jgi:hypothetical protein
MKRGLQFVAAMFMSLILSAGLLPAQSGWNRGYEQGQRSRGYDSGQRYGRGNYYGHNQYGGQWDDGYYRRDHRVGRSLAIVGGGAAAGAVIGGASAGGRGAAIGAAIGGISGLVLDQAVRHHHHRE